MSETPSAEKRALLKKPLTLGDVTLSSRVLLAPLAGVSDLPFRLICREQGAALVCTEMISAKAVYYGNKGTDRLMQTVPGEAPLSLQLFGSDPEILGRIADKIAPHPNRILDLNMGCPVPKVVKNGEGSALMRDPALAERIFTALVKAAGKPVTVKRRSGFTQSEQNAPELARIAEACGVSAVIVHGRTREQGYSGKADLQVIRRVKEAVSIPVIGNGDVTDGPSAVRMLIETGCDAVMVGRAAQGNPWVFREILSYAETGALPRAPKMAEIRKTAERHGKMLVMLKGEEVAMREMRKHLAWYTKGIRGSARLRGKMNELTRMDQLFEILDALEEKEVE